MKITLSKSQWNLIGQKTGWIKIAKEIIVEYDVGFGGETKKARVRVDPSEIHQGETIRDTVQRKLDKREKVPVVIHKYIPVEAIRTKVGPSQKDLQRLRGEKMRKEREARLRREEREKAEKAEKQGIKPQDIIKQMEEQDTDLNLVDILKNRQEIRSPELQKAQTKDIVELVKEKTEKEKAKDQEKSNKDISELIRERVQAPAQNPQFEALFADNKSNIKLSKAQWELIGNKTGWIKSSSNHKVFDSKKEALAFLREHALMSVGWKDGGKSMEACYWNGKVHITESDIKTAQVINDDGIMDGGERYTDEELDLMEKEKTENKTIERMKQLNATSKQIESAKKIIENYKKEPKEVFPYIGGDNVIMLDFGFIMIGIETDGYAHS